MVLNKTPKPPTVKSAVTTKKHVVSSPRSKKSSELKPISFRLSPRQLAELDVIAASRKMSRSNLIVDALERCKSDGIWRPGVHRNVACNTSVVPPKEVVTLSNNLLALAMVVEQLMKRGSKKNRDNASRIYLDARLSLAELREAIGC